MKMKFKKSAILLFVPVIISFLSCEDFSKETRKRETFAEDNTVYYPASTTTKTVHFPTGNFSPIIFSCEDSWVSVVPLRNGSEFEITVQTNTFTRARTSKVVMTATADNQTKTFPIYQYAKNVPAPTSAPYRLGDIYFENGIAGVVYKITNGGRNGMIISLKYTLCEWSSSSIYVGCSDPNNGVNNMDAVKRMANWQTLFPAFKWCEELNTEGVTGWYLPAINELKEIYAGYSGLSHYPGYVLGTEDDLYKGARAKFNYSMLFYDGCDLEPQRVYGGSSEYEDSMIIGICEKAYFMLMNNAVYGGRTKSFLSRFHAVRAF